MPCPFRLMIVIMIEALGVIKSEAEKCAGVMVIRLASSSPSEAVRRVISARIAMTSTLRLITVVNNEGVHHPSVVPPLSELVKIIPYTERQSVSSGLKVVTA